MPGFGTAGTRAAVLGWRGECRPGFWGECVQRASLRAGLPGTARLLPRCSRSQAVKLAANSRSVASRAPTMLTAGQADPTDPLTREAADRIGGVLWPDESSEEMS